jgi:general secretion pathway protein H
MTGSSFSPETSNGESGFTLAEMIVVLVVLGLALAVALPLGRRSAETAGMEKAAVEIAAHLRNARTRAISRNEEVTVTFDLEGQLVKADGSRASVIIPADAQLELIAAREEVTGRHAAIRFYPDGSSTGGTIRLHDGNRSIRIRISWLTGLIERRAEDARSTR